MIPLPTHIFPQPGPGATMAQFTHEAGKIIKGLYELHRNSRADYKSAAERVSVVKMPKATENERRKFVQFALRVFDLARAAEGSNVDLSASAAEMGQRVLGSLNRN